MDATEEYEAGERLLESVEDSCAVDPEAFLERCQTLEVWDNWGGIDVFEAMLNAFDFGAISATFRFFEVSHGLRDGTLTEFMSSDDEGNVSVPNALFLAAATAWLDPETHRIDRRDWAEGIMRILAGAGLSDEAA